MTRHVPSDNFDGEPGEAALHKKKVWPGGSGLLYSAGETADNGQLNTASPEGCGYKGVKALLVGNEEGF
jgi:hypothetical protein